VTLTKARKITGLDIRTGADHGSSMVHYAAYYTDGAYCAEVRGRHEGESLRRLVEFCYKLTQDAVFERDGWCCVRCKNFRNLQTHHIVHRSKERIDRKDLLRTICDTCHRRITDGLAPEFPAQEETA
jgi:hypothetical protein